ncbi:hypothetical protein CRE_05084 [Caenorhabditis remanei]|uniref:Uncharacterized protein n=1 Tax=Caenorhabditis remanei TaxID=31234 RepID=E3MZ41_CAERE|nr:hypothetical protein CRE_05084 [Caenorhabditis remanei]
METGKLTVLILSDRCRSPFLSGNCSITLWPIVSRTLLLIFCASSIIMMYYSYNSDYGTVGLPTDHNLKRISKNASAISEFKYVRPVARVKKGNKWIVVTSISYPTEDVKRLASIEDWNLVVVADTKTPVDWKLDDVHFLPVLYQKTLPFSLSYSLPYKSYTRKNIGYLYAIAQGAEWIYDTDDDNKPYDKRGLDQFDYDETISGVRFQVKNSEAGVLERLFNPYRFYGIDQMWPRGFPLEHIEKHSNGKEHQVLCYKMKRSSVQQGLVHHDPDVDAVYRLLHADPKSGLDIKFNMFSPPITLSVGTYSPWNSQNTLFHKSAFHTLFLPTTVSFRTTDIWRSFISQKILHLSGLTVSFVPTNAIQFRNAHDYLKDFKDEKQVYEDSGKMIEFLSNWKCLNGNSLEGCINDLLKDLVTNNLWGKEDFKLMSFFLNDLKYMGFEFPELIGENYQDPYTASNNEEDRNVNCRRMNLEFDLVDPREYQRQNIIKAEQKLNYFGDLVEWCNEAGYHNLSKQFPSANQLAKKHDESYVLQNDKDSVLIVVNNYPWKYGHGIIQRLYQPYFASVVFCGPWYPDVIIEQDNFTSTINPINYIHINPVELRRGYYGYHCVSLVKEMRFNNVRGYFVMSDDAIFNLWQRIDYSRVHHLVGVNHANDPLWWFVDDYGIVAARKIVESIKTNTDPKVSETWKRFSDGLKANGYVRKGWSVNQEMTSGSGRSQSDFFYLPSSEIDYFASLMRIFYQHNFFLELAINKFLKSVRHQTSLIRSSSYIWLEKRDHWAEVYDKNMVGFHAVKLSDFQKPGEKRKKYCEAFLQLWFDIILGGSQNFTVKADDDADYRNG